MSVLTTSLNAWFKLSSMGLMVEEGTHKRHRGLAEEVCPRRMEAAEKVVLVFGSDDCRCIPFVVVIDTPVVVETGLGLPVDGTQLVVAVEVGFVLLVDSRPVVAVEGFVLPVDSRPVLAVEGFVLPVDRRLVVVVEGFVLPEDNKLVGEVDFV